MYKEEFIKMLSSEIKRIDRILTNEKLTESQKALFYQLLFIMKIEELRKDIILKK